MKNLKLLKLKRHSEYLAPVDWSHTSTPTGGSDDIPSWWINASDKLKKEVLSETEKVEDIEAVCQIIAKLEDVTIFSHEINLKRDGYANPQVIANKDIVESIDLVETFKEPVAGDMVCIEWIDASHNSTPATVDEVKDASGVIRVASLGFLMHTNEERVFVGGRFNHNWNKYRYLTAIPNVNIKSVKLKAK